MKVTIGDLTVEVNAGEEDMAFNLINRLVSGKATPVSKSASKSAKPAKAKRKAVKLVEADDKPLSNQLQTTLEYMAHTDASSGLSIPEIANGLSITTHAAQWRINKLVRQGWAHKVSPGMYRPGVA
jgi:hypothetical protein